ncbi:MAG: GNAT family N-acyltransferase [Thermodesulfobacteriota bacterium]|nr:GNAT family N-acyltransferase [Thermodesulfobacteriota bacterium]
MQEKNYTRDGHQYKPVDVEPDQRLLRRISVRENEGVKAVVTIPDVLREWECNVLDVSSMGFCLESEKPPNVNFEKGQIAEIGLLCQANCYQFTCTVCHVSTTNKGRQRVGLRRSGVSNAGELLPYPLQQISMPAVTRHPYFYNEDVVVQIVGISKNHCTVECNDPEFLVLPSMPMTLSLHIVEQRGNDIEGQVTWVNVLETGVMRFGLVIHRMPDKTRKAIARYLFQLQEWKPRELKAMGFEFKRYRSLIKFRSIQTHNEYSKVLALRRNAYLSVGKIGPESRDTDLASDLDRKSRIVAAFHQGRLVGTVSVLFPDCEEMVLDTERAFEKGYPVRMPPKTEMIEIARLCIAPDYRSTDILWGMFEEIYRILITSDRKYVVTSTDDRMWTLYRQIGFRKIGAAYDHPVFRGIEHEVILLHRDSALWGKYISPFVWGYLYRNMTAYLVSIGVVQFNPYQRMRILLNKALFGIYKYAKGITRQK